MNILDYLIVCITFSFVLPIFNLNYGDYTLLLFLGFDYHIFVFVIHKDMC